MNFRGVTSRLLLPVLRYTLGYLPSVRTLAAKTCVLLEESRDPEASLRWIFDIHAFVEQCIDRQAIAWGNGVHIKHELMTGIHAFVCGRMPHGSSVLDVGCCIGALTHAISVQVPNVRVVGMDFNASHIRFARERFFRDNLSFIEGDATQYRSHQQMDIIVLSSLLEHIVDRVGLLRTLVSMYHPVCLLIRVPLFERHFHAPLKRHLNLFPYTDRDHKIEYTEESFLSEMTSAGLVVLSHHVRWGDLWAECKPFSNSDLQ